MNFDEASSVTYEQSGHKAIKHEKCTNNYCQFCDGGLFGCENCLSFEGATTTHCPDGDMTYEQMELVYKGELDYRDGAWIEDTSPHCPYGIRRRYDS